MSQIAVAELTIEAFAPFGSSGMPIAHGVRGAGDVALAGPVSFPP
jgi:hypothetical protein